MISSLLLIAAAPGAVAAPVPRPVAGAVPSLPTTLPAVKPADKSDIGFMTARDLANKCSDVSSAAISYCFAYIAAVHDTMRAYEIWLGQKEFCLPAASSQGDLRRTFLTYLSAYPDNGAGQASSVVAVAFKQTYVCAVPPAAKVSATPRP